ncbi:MAG: hypothetical protein HYT87_05685 [Nitrospirae bacterium]|nr:hypothetical protein [Nitrospirota bacterium]
MTQDNTHALDFIGVDAYFPLTNSREAAYEQIFAGWGKHAAEVLKTFFTAP